MNRAKLMRLAWLVLGTLLLALPASAVEVGQVTRLTGQADVTRGEAPPRPLQLGDPIHQHDILRTKSRSMLEVTLADKSRLSMGENSRINIARFQSEGEPAGLIEVTRGKLRAFVTDLFSRRSESFKVKTPTAIAGVVGTDFAVTVFARHTRVFVFKGVVVVVNADPKVKGRVVLHKNQSSTVWEGEPPSLPEGFQQWLDDFISGGGSGSEDEESAKGGTSGDEQSVEGEPLPPPGSEATPTGITPTPPDEPPTPPDEPPTPPEEPPTPPEEPPTPPEEPPTPPDEPPTPPEEPPTPPDEPPTPPEEPPSPPEEPPSPPEEPPSPPADVPPGPPEGIPPGPPPGLPHGPPEDSAPPPDEPPDSGDSGIPPPSVSPVPPRDDTPASSGPPQGPPDTPVGPDDTPHGPPPEHPGRGKGKDK